MRWTKAEKEFVATARVARLATVDAKGVPHNVPICPLLDSGKLYFGSEAKAKKVRNLRAHLSVALVFDDYTDAWAYLRGMMIQGQARAVNSRTFRAVRKKIYAKFPQYPSDAPLEEGGSAIIEVIPKRKVTWGLQ